MVDAGHREWAGLGVMLAALALEVLADVRHAVPAWFDGLPVAILVLAGLSLSQPGLLSLRGLNRTFGQIYQDFRTGAQPRSTGVRYTTFLVAIAVFALQVYAGFHGFPKAA